MQDHGVDFIKCHYKIIKFHQDTDQDMKGRYQACMLLAAAGDAIGFRRGLWEFNYNGESIHQEMNRMTNGKGINALVVNQTDFPYSDDTVMHLATARALVETRQNDQLSYICQKVAKHYKDCIKQMPNRYPGVTCLRTIQKINVQGSNWDTIPFDKKGGGCGASMRSACFGLYLPRNVPKMIELSIETGRMTHHNPLGYLGSVVSAYFTALAIRSVPPHQWLSHLFNNALPYSKSYVGRNREAQSNLNNGDWQKFQESWRQYALTRKMSLIEPSIPQFPLIFGVKERQNYYNELAITGWPGALGIDSVLIAYDALLGCKQNWEELCLRSMLHGGDSDSTGTIAGAWFGAAYGFKGVPKEHTDYLQGRQQLINLADRLYEMSKQARQ